MLDQTEKDSFNNLLMALLELLILSLGHLQKGLLKECNALIMAKHELDKDGISLLVRRLLGLVLLLLLILLGLLGLLLSLVELFGLTVSFFMGEGG